MLFAGAGGHQHRLEGLQSLLHLLRHCHSNDLLAISRHRALAGYEHHRATIDDPLAVGAHWGWGSGCVDGCLTCPRAQSLVAALDLALNPVPVVGELRGAPGGVPVVAGDALLVHRPLVSEGEHAGLAGHGGAACRGTGVDGLRGSVAGGVDHRGVRGVDFAVPFGLQGPVVAVLSDELLVVRLRGKVGAVCCRGRGHLCSLDFVQGFLSDLLDILHHNPCDNLVARGGGEAPGIRVVVPSPIPNRG
mmetsp:Transcript_18186/g.30113  ORF Transcript_18186/g.30113 Transcript_18186/m.30113 type:complete len:247 (+) Transcript_18186:1066-1806(+)